MQHEQHGQQQGHGAAESGHGAHTAGGDEAEHGEGGGHGQGAHEGHHGPGDINWFTFGNPKQPPLIANLINFAILVWVFWRFGREPIAKALSRRREDIKQKIDEAQRIKREAKERAKKYQKNLENLEAEKDEAQKALVIAGNADKERILREAEAAAGRMERDAKALLASEIAQLKQDLSRETVEMAMTAAEELVRARITASDHERLAEEFLQDLAARNAKDKPTSPASGTRGPSGAGGGSARPPVLPRPASVPPRAVTSPNPNGANAPVPFPPNTSLPTGGSE
ncbi:hypothetical protein [Pendulispora albinea]|uniref:ATP synthase subunit b n=1 Tax=Pendulispora albinea TaxID=2741071 RepID=A0ABZ2M294_9BACT